MRVQRAELPALLTGHAAARRFFAPYFKAGDPLLECLCVAHVDRASRCLHIERYEGAPASVGIPIREIVKDATRLGSAAILLAHNHPSGDARPSEADYRATRKLAVAAYAVDVALLDHLIFANGKCSSLRQMGFL